jgi:hypothetical protein
MRSKRSGAHFVVFIREVIEALLWVPDHISQTQEYPSVPVLHLLEYSGQYDYVLYGRMLQKVGLVKHDVGVDD